MSAGSTLPSSNARRSPCSSLDVRLGLHRAVGECDRGCRPLIVGCASAEAVVGLRQPVVLHVADGEPMHRLARSGGARSRAHAGRRALVERPAEHVLRDDVHPAARGEQHPRAPSSSPRPRCPSRCCPSRRRPRRLPVVAVGAVDVVVRVHLPPSNVAREGAARASAGPSGGRWRRAPRRSVRSRRVDSSSSQAPSSRRVRVLDARSRTGSGRGSRSGRRSRRSRRAICVWCGKSGYDAGIG